MKKLFMMLAVLTLFIGCAPANQTSENEDEQLVEEEVNGQETVEAEGLKIISPQGAPALTLIPIVNDGKNEVVTVEGADAITAELSKPTPEYDVIIAPTNLGVKLASTGNSSYKLLAVVDWGNLYIVGSDETALDEGHELAAFGENAVPGLVFNKAYSDVKANVTFYNDVSDAREMLLSQNADAALLAEPAATATIAAAKKNGMELKVISNVQEKWGDEGFPMAALFVNSETYEANKSMYEDLLTKMDEYADAVSEDTAAQVVSDIESKGAEFYGVPNAEIIGKSYQRINIDITKASECKDQIAQFLEIFNVTDIDDALITE